MLLVCNHDVISKDSVSSKGECPNYLSSESYLGPIWLARNGPVSGGTGQPVSKLGVFWSRSKVGQATAERTLRDLPLIVKDAKWKKSIVSPS
jgi:hypothetical protein